jgi:hypothetical protein
MADGGSARAAKRPKANEAMLVFHFLHVLLFLIMLIYQPDKKANSVQARRPTI